MRNESTILPTSLVFQSEFHIHNADLAIERFIRIEDGVSASYIQSS